MVDNKARKAASPAKKGAAKKSATPKKGVRPKKASSGSKPPTTGKAPKSVAVKAFPVVGIGASAGGLEAIEDFFDHLPPSCNMPFVIIQHLSSGHKSIMGSLLEKHTSLKVVEITDGMAVTPGCVYLNPADKDVDIIAGVLRLSSPAVKHATRLPIDHFFRSLAVDKGEMAVCIVLSGTGSDGTLGLKAVKGEGGMAMAQVETQAKYSGMPSSAIATGLVDFVLPVEEMSAELARYARHPFIVTPGRASAIDNKLAGDIQKIFLLIRAATGHDFSNYKQNTIRRRIERRMAVHQIVNLQDYIKYLRQSPTEVQTLSRDLLITVTSFFRDPEAYEALTVKAVKEILKGKEDGGTVRIWVPGCASGEEAYSIVILFIEGAEKIKKHINIQAFATDLDPDAIDKARSGVYPDSIAANVSAARLKRFFVKEDGAFRVKKQVRDMLVFAAHNLVKDPPFSKLDLVSCRNVLIYMNTVLQHRVIPLFHYTLARNGFLFLGSSETIGKFSDLFATIDTKWKLFRRKGAATDRAVEYPFLPLGQPAQVAYDTEAEAAGAPYRPSVKSVAERLILDDYSSPCVLVNQKCEIQYFHGKTDKFLSPPTGEPRFNILKMASGEISDKLSVALHRAFKDQRTVVAEGIRTNREGVDHLLDIIIRPVAGPTASAGEMMMVVFDERPAADKPSVKAKKGGREADPRLAALESELKSTRAYLQNTIEELETSNEELKSTNEELQSTNEELQSTNEELETSKEELHSTNEELETVNSELQSKVDELSKTNDDMSNLLASTDIGTVFLDNEMRIKRYTPSATELFNLIPSDMGRPLADITPRFEYDSFITDARQVVKTLTRKEVEVVTKDRRWFSVRIMPYRTLDNVIDGVVATFTDISKLKHAETLRHMATIVNDSNDAVTVHDLDGRITAWNRAAEDIYGYTKAEAVGMNISRLLPDREKKKALETIGLIKKGQVVEPAETSRVTRDGRVIDILLTVTKLVDEKGEVVAVATTEHDITVAKQAERGYQDRITALEHELSGLKKG